MMGSRAFTLLLLDKFSHRPLGAARPVISPRCGPLRRAFSFSPIAPSLFSAPGSLRSPLAARLGDLVPTGADVAALPGIEPVTGALSDLVDRNDGGRHGDMEGHMSNGAFTGARALARRAI